MTLRSDRWVRGDNEVALDSRVALKMGGAAVDAAGGRPIIGVANSASDLNPCNQPLADLLAPLREGIATAGGIAVEFPVLSLGEDLMKPTSMLYRNLLAMEIEESLRSQPLDGIVVLAACDKSVPGALMGAFSTNLPCLLLVSGPRPAAHFEGRRVGTGTDLWRMWDERRRGALSDERWRAFEDALTLGRGTCNTMGTASSMGAIAEALGLAWPGSTSIPAGDPRHVEVARRVGGRIVELVGEGASAAIQVTPEAVTNAAALLCALGGSTNAVIHLTAMAGRLGHAVAVDTFDELSRRVPVLVDLEPTGTALMEDLDAAGGVPTVLGQLGALVEGSVRLADGSTTRELQQGARAANGPVRSLDDPVDAAGAFRVVRGNLAPDGALIKRSAATPALLRHRGPAYVMHGAKELAERTGPGAQVREDAVLVLSGVGPVGGPGMPEWGMVDIPEPLLAGGVRDMVRVTDARMSGTSFGTVFLHVAPEGAVGGAIGLVRDGDLIEVDADAGTVHVEVSDEELERRRDEAGATGGPSRGYVALYRRHVTQAPAGCDFDFLALAAGATPQLDEPVVGRS
ncbi:MAG TPA: dihydroxy-acid dehydratase [Acidimicrobiales bacterium]|nr:dihydroxy-acid dehydratase [Acidimicrobiales bacterium]